MLKGEKPERFYDRLKGGWPEHSAHLLSWCLSCLQLKKYYGEVELFTDRLGKRILIDHLQLPYSKVHLSLDGLAQFQDQLWALGKILTYSAQTRPFIHVDSDVYLFSRFPGKVENAGLLCQNFDVNHKEYYSAFETIDEHGIQLPEVMTSERKTAICLVACNAGILGGNDWKFFREYGKIAFRIVAENEHKLARLHFPRFNIILEQYLFYCLARKRNKKITPLFAQLNDGAPPVDWVRFNTVPHRQKYIHMISGFKRNAELYNKVLLLIRTEYPHYYYRVRKLLEDYCLQGDH